MECNRLIKAFLKAEVDCNEDLFGVFCLFANGILDFNQVLRTAESYNINFVDLCNKNNFDLEKIIKRE